MVLKSTMAKHRNACGKKKPVKPRKAIKRYSYARNKDKILRKRLEKRLFDQFRRLEVARSQLAELEVEDEEDETPWTPLSETNILYGVSNEPYLFAYFLMELNSTCNARHNRDPTMLAPKDLYRADIFVLHPDKLKAAKGERLDNMQDFWESTIEGRRRIQAPRRKLDAMTDVEHANGRRRVRLAQVAMDKAEGTLIKLITLLPLYRKKVDSYMRAKERRTADLEARQAKAQKERPGLIEKLKTKIAKLESVGSCATFEDYKSSYLKAKEMLRTPSDNQA